MRAIPYASLVENRSAPLVENRCACLVEKSECLSRGEPMCLPRGKTGVPFSWRTALVEKPEKNQHGPGSYSNMKDVSAYIQAWGVSTRIFGCGIRRGTSNKIETQPETQPKPCHREHLPPCDSLLPHFSRIKNLSKVASRSQPCGSEHHQVEIRNLNFKL